MRKFFRVLCYACVSLLVVLMGFVAWANFRINRDEVIRASEGAPGRFFKLRGRDWHVITRGSMLAQPAPPILLLHGFSAAGQLMWNPISGRLAANRSLILPDILGYGHSERITAPGPHYTLTSYAASIAELLDQLGAQQVDVVGHSFGGVIAARFALDYPQRVRRIVFIDAAVYYEKQPVFDSVLQWPLGIGSAATWSMTGTGPLSLVARYCAGQKSDECRRLLRAKGNTAATQAMMYTQNHTHDSVGFARELSRISAPALVIWGENDRLFPAAHGKRLAEQLNARLVLVRDGRHMPFVYKPVEVADAVSNFLADEALSKQ